MNTLLPFRFQHQRDTPGPSEKGNPSLRSGGLLVTWLVWCDDLMTEASQQSDAEIKSPKTCQLNCHLLNNPDRKTLLPHPTYPKAACVKLYLWQCHARNLG